MGVTINAQFDGDAFYPHTLCDQDEVACFKKNQIVTITVKATKKAPSVRQMGLYWAACNLYAHNTEDRYFNTKDKVDLQLRVALNFIDMNKSVVDKNGNFHPQYRSISFENLRQIERTRYFDQAFELMAEWLGVSVETLIHEVKLSMERKKARRRK